MSGSGGAEPATRDLLEDVGFEPQRAVHRQPPAALSAIVPARAEVGGKHFFAGDRKLYVRGVTYGAFRPDENGDEYGDLEKVDRDFAQMAVHGFNAVRIPHTSPPLAVLDVAQRHRLRVMVGLSCEQYVGYLIDRKGAPNIEELVRDKVRALRSHPSLLCYALGNEIPAPLVRLVGPRKIERYLRRLHHAVKDEDPAAVVTYVNYPTTEYLQLPFLDFVAFNVYLEDDHRLSAYLTRLHHIADDRPLLMSEIGLDSIRSGLHEQASSLGRQLRTTFEAGCAGAFVFSWTDEWHRGGADVDDWAFGLTDAERRPKPALVTVAGALRDLPFGERDDWSRISVIVCAYNAGETLRECLEGIARLDYPEYDVIVVDDGSSDDTAAIAREFDCKLVQIPNGGLSAARNVGLERATGDIVAYIDSDAYPDPHWLQHMANALADGRFAGMGGPNIAPAGDGQVADAVSHSPGGPLHVMLDDRVAEHIPGCNMAFRREDLVRAGGFDPRFRVAGDDVDACWRIQDAGGMLGFSPAASVWHHRRKSVRAYWRQQRQYGIAERLLEEKWPEKYNGLGHVSWSGRIYGRGYTPPLGRMSRIYHGLWGSAPFQSLYERQPHSFWVTAALPEWWLAIFMLAVLGALGTLWKPLLLALAPALIGSGLAVARAVLSTRSTYSVAPLRLRALTVLLHILQPLARLRGRFANRHARRHCTPPLRVPRTRRHAQWNETWEDPYLRLARIHGSLASAGGTVLHGGAYNRFELEVRRGAFGAARLVMAVEDHGSGTQYFRFRSWPRASPLAVALAAALIALSVAAGLDGALAVAISVGLLSTGFAWLILGQCARATGQVLSALEDVDARQ